MDKIKRLKELIEQLNHYRDSYYNDSESLISDKQYDGLFDKLAKLEKETGITMSNSPTQTVGYEVKSKLNKVVHNHPMLSLDKTKSVSVIAKFFKYKPGLAMLKMDGLTCSVAYHNDLISAESRGNGEIGEDLLHNAKVVTNLPLKVNHDDLIVDGEMIIDYPTFEKINDSMLEDSKFKNPRNLCSGSIRQLDSRIAAKRGIKFVAWKCIKGINDNDFVNRLTKLKEYGFEVVPFIEVPNNPSEDQIEVIINELKKQANEKGYPIDGIVFSYRDVAYGEALGMTSHHINSQIAFKFKNDIEYTTLNGIQWQVGKTGQITPVGLLDTINILDTDVSKVSLHNIKVMEDLNIKIGATVGIIKSNEIIPMCVECDGNGKDVIIPDTCPECGYKTEIVSTGDSKILMCNNPNCKGKLLNKLVNFCSRDAMNIDGLSEATLSVLLDKDFIHSYKDIFHLNEHKAELSALPKMGAKSVAKLLKSIEHSRKTTLDKFLTSLSIPFIGKSTAKEIAKYCHGSIDKFTFIMNNTSLEFAAIDGIGVAATTSLDDWWNENNIMFYELLEELEITQTENTESAKTENNKRLDGMTFVVTGSVTRFKNRAELQEKIESLGGKVSGSVSAKTNVLLNNDANSNSSKNVKAKSLNIPIWTEDQFLDYIGKTN